VKICNEVVDVKYYIGILLEEFFVLREYILLRKKTHYFNFSLDSKP